MELNPKLAALIAQARAQKQKPKTEPLSSLNAAVHVKIALAQPDVAPAPPAIKWYSHQRIAKITCFKCLNCQAEHLSATQMFVEQWAKVANRLCRKLVATETPTPPGVYVAAELVHANTPFCPHCVTSFGDPLPPPNIAVFED